MVLQGIDGERAHMQCLISSLLLAALSSYLSDFDQATVLTKLSAEQQQ